MGGQVPDPSLTLPIPLSGDAAELGLLEGPARALEAFP